ncbi:MAG: energy-coupling factor ABC transporter substrate-binding protein [Allorhizobium sp.]
MTMMKRNLLMLLAVAALAILPLIIHHGGDAEFAGADGEAQAAIGEIQPDYKPWASPLWTPPSGEVEGLLFALQAALGAALLGFYFGRRSAPGRRSDIPSSDA